MSKKIKFLIIGAPFTSNTNDLVLEIKKKGHLVKKVKPKDLIFYAEKEKFNIKAEKIDLFKFDIFIFRGYTINLEATRLLANYLLRLNKVVIDDVIGKDYILGKIYQSSFVSSKIDNLNFPKTFQVVGLESLSQIKNKLSYPLIIKPVDGQKGQDIHKVNSYKEILKILKENPKNYIIQEFLEIDGDYRVFVIGRKVLGAIKRNIIEGDFRSNASLGAKAEEVVLSEKMKKIALDITRLLKFEIAGVDLAMFKNKIYLIEVNITPQWQAFKKITGLNPAEHIIDYALKKYDKKNGK